MSQHTKAPITHSMDRRGDINMDPDTRPIKAQVGTDEEASTGALGVLPVLSKQEKNDKHQQLPKINYNFSHQTNMYTSIYLVIYLHYCMLLVFKCWLTGNTVVTKTE